MKLNPFTVAPRTVPYGEVEDFTPEPKGQNVLVCCRGNSARRSVGVTYKEREEAKKGRLHILVSKDLRRDVLILTDGKKTERVAVKRIPLSPDYFVMTKGGKNKQFLFNKRIEKPWIITDPPEVAGKEGKGVQFT